MGRCPVVPWRQADVAVAAARQDFQRVLKLNRIIAAQVPPDEVVERPVDAGVEDGGAADFQVDEIVCCWRGHLRPPVAVLGPVPMPWDGQQVSLDY